MEAEITIKEISARLTLTQEELSKLKQYIEGTLQIGSYMSSFVGDDVIEFARNLDGFLADTIKGIG